MKSLLRLASKLAPRTAARLGELSKRVRWLDWLAERDSAFLDYGHRQEFLRRAFRTLRFNGIDGDYAEFGCAGCITFRLAWEESRRGGYPCRLWALDSFAGLPAPAGPEDEHPRWNEGELKTSLAAFLALCQRGGIPQKDYEVVAGFYDDTLVGDGADPGELPADIALAYIDCDLYSSTRTVLRFLGPRLKHGMIVAFDDFYCYSATALAGERRALLEYVADESRFRFVPYIQFGWGGMSFLVEDAALYGDLAPADRPLPW